MTDIPHARLYSPQARITSEKRSSIKYIRIIIVSHHSVIFDQIFSVFQSDMLQQKPVQYSVICQRTSTPAEQPC